MKRIYTNIFTAALCTLGLTALAQTDSLVYTGGIQKIIVPACVDSIRVDIAGAQGGGANENSTIGNNGGLGGHVLATIPVNPGDSLFIYVGGHGDSAMAPTAGGAGGFNGGDSGATIWGNYAGGGGGGATDIRLNDTTLANRVVVAGGGGGGAYDCSFLAEQGGSGGGLKGDSGSHCDPEYALGGTQTAGGAGAIYGGYGTGGDGTLGRGGKGGNPSAGGGGGGGYYGGGGGSWGGGGGGSGYTEPSASNVIDTNGYEAGDGYAKISFIAAPKPTATLTATKDTNCITISKDSLIGLPMGGAFSGTGVTGSNFDPSSAGAGSYTLYYVYTDSLGCAADTATTEVVVNLCTGIQQVNSLNTTIHFYPNPFTVNVIVEINTKEPIALNMFNSMGQEVGTWALKQGKNIINTSDLPGGIYLMQVKSQNGILNKKLIKTN